MEYTYLAKVEFITSSAQVKVTLCDIPSMESLNDNVSRAVQQVKDELVDWLYKVETLGGEVPVASEPWSVNLGKDEVLMAINVDTRIAEARELSKLTKKTLTIPSYLNELGTEKGINFSKILTDSLKAILID